MAISPRRSIHAGLMLAVTLWGCAGCQSSVRVTDPPRSATEQFLLTVAASRAIEQLSVDALRGRQVYIDTQHFSAPEQGFVLSELRAKLLMSGVQLMPERGAAQIIMEVRSLGVGIDRSDLLVGIPSVLIRAGGVEDETGETTIPLATPELALVKNVDQRGVASIAFIAYWKDTGEVVANSGPYLGLTRREDWWFIGLGRRTAGDIAPVEAAK